jgi:hypothetical protein
MGSAPTESGISEIVGALRRVVLGQDDATRDCVLALVAGGHVLLEGVPGTAKTLLVRTLARLLDVSYARVQFTPDLMPSDVTGISVLAQSGEFVFHCGVIETARKHRAKLGRVYAGRNGILGALTEDMIDTSAESAKTIAALRHTPGGAFGSARYKLKGLDQNRAEYERLIQVFKAHDIGYFFYNGGGDSMDTAWKVSQLGEEAGGR